MSQKTALFLDTTIQVHRVVDEHDDEIMRSVADALRQAKPHIVCAYSRMEYKRVVLQNYALALRYLCEEQSFFGALRRAMRIQRRPRRVSTLISILAWTGQQAAGVVDVEEGSELDRMLTQRSIAYLRNVIRFLWARFEGDVEIVDRLQCQRGREAPRPTNNGGFDASIPETACRDRGCNNANVFRAELPRLRMVAKAIEMAPAEHQTDELKQAARAIEAALSNPNRLYDHPRCLELADVWIHLEAVMAQLADFATSNYRESRVFCPALGLTPHWVSRDATAVSKLKGTPTAEPR
jgi:hypothetical protein